MERRILTESELADGLTSLTGWTVDGRAIKKRWEFKNFAEALDFVNRTGAVAEAADHHPDISFGWGYAELVVTTHDRGGVTDVDLSLARQVESNRSA